MAVTYSVQVYEVDGNTKPAQAYNFPASSLVVPYNGGNDSLNSVIYPGNGHGYAVAETQAALNDLASTYSVDVYEIDGNAKATPVSYNFPGSSFVTPYNGNNADLNSVIYPGDGHGYSVAETADALNTLANAGGGGGSSLFPTSGTGTATDDVVADAATKNITILNGGVIESNATAHNFLGGPGSFSQGIKAGSVSVWFLGDAAEGSVTPDYYIQVQVGDLIFRIPGELQPD